MGAHFICAHCQHAGPEVQYWPWNVMAGHRTPLCGDLVECENRWNREHWPQGNEPGGAVADQIARRKAA